MVRRYPVRVVLYSLVTAVVAVLLVLGVAAIRVVADSNTRARATVEAVGHITSGFSPGDDQAMVAWSDADNHEYLTTFVLDDPAKWHAEQQFRVRYDPTEGVRTDVGPLLADLPPDKTNVVAVEPGARNAAQPSGWDYWWPSAVIGGLVSLVLAAWVVRWRRNVTVAAKEPVQMRVVVVRGRNQVSLGTSGHVAEVLLARPGETSLDLDVEFPARAMPGVWWQRVYWDPELERIVPGQTIPVHLLDGFGRRAVPEPRPGVRIWPAGRLRRKPVRGLVYEAQPHREHPSHDPVKPPVAIWFVPLAAGIFGAARGHVIADAPVFVLAAFVLATFLWAWTGPAPA